MGVGENFAEAERCEKQAAAHDEMADEAEQAQAKAEWTCGDRAFADQATSGGERLSPRSPCWSGARSDAERHRESAQRLRDEARAHRSAARELIDAEATACASVSDEDLDHTPFVHQNDIASVAAELDGDHVAGARIRFRKVEGLDAAWLRTVIDCHRARAATLGWDPTYMGYDPSLVANTDVTVDDADGVVVVVRGQDDAAALAAYGRAEDLLGGR